MYVNSKNQGRGPWAAWPVNLRAVFFDVHERIIDSPQGPLLIALPACLCPHDAVSNEICQTCGCAVPVAGSNLDNPLRYATGRWP